MRTCLADSFQFAREKVRKLDADEPLGKLAGE